MKTILSHIRQLSFLGIFQPIRVDRKFSIVIKRSHKFLFIAAIAILTTTSIGCQKKEQFHSTIQIDKSSISKKANYSELFEYSEIIYLESSFDCFIGSIDKILFKNNLFFILDRTISKGVFVFNRDGSFKYKVQTIGKGPREYSRIHDFDITIEDLWIFAGYPNKILNYSLDGKFKGEKATKAAGTRFAVFDEEHYLVYTCGLAENNPTQEMTKNILELSREGMITNAFLKNGTVNRNYKNCYSPPYSGFFRDGGSILFSFPFSDTIFEYCGFTVEPKYIFDFGDYTIPKGLSIASREQIAEKGYAHGISRICEDENILFFTVKISDNWIYVIFDKNSNKYIATRKLFDDLYFVFPTIISISNDFIVGFSEASSILYVSQNSHIYGQKESSMINEIASVIDEGSNPVVFLLTPKKVKK